MYLHEVSGAGDPPGDPTDRASRDGSSPDGSSRQGPEMPEILHLIAYRPDATEHLARFTQEVMRGPSELSPGQRELIAAFTSNRNGCPF